MSSGPFNAKNRNSLHHLIDGCTKCNSKPLKDLVTVGSVNKVEAPIIVWNLGKLKGKPTDKLQSYSV